MNKRDSSASHAPITPHASMSSSMNMNNHSSVQTTPAPSSGNVGRSRQEDIANASHAAALNDFRIRQRQGYGDCRQSDADYCFGAEPVRNPDGEFVPFRSKIKVLLYYTLNCMKSSNVYLSLS
jgi:hypothetical protein